MHPNPRASQMDVILRLSNARSSPTYIFILARGTTICAGSVKRWAKDGRLSARDCRMVAELQSEAPNRRHDIRFVGARRIVQILIEALALSERRQSSSVAAS